MSVKLPILLVSAAFTAGVFAAGSGKSSFDMPWAAFADDMRAQSPPSLQPPPDDTRSQPDLASLAHEIRTVRLPQAKTERLPPPPPIAPLQLAQVENPTGDAVEKTPPEVDESALRYFAARGDTQRLAAEIARLRALYPDWTPPEDPLAVPQNADRQLEEMWQLYARGHYPEVRKAIIDRQAEDPGWQPPADLLDRLQIAEARARLVNASDLKQYLTVIEVGSANPALLNCSEVDVLWRVAEAFAQTERAQRALDAYSYILTNCVDPAERVATMQKAAALLPYSYVQPLFALEKAVDEGREFSPIRDDLARRFVAEASEDPALEIAPEYLQQVKDQALANGPASDSLLLGWYYLRRKDMVAAEDWFRRAREGEDSASASQGLALVLIEKKEPAEAEAALYRWRDSSDDAMATYLAAVANLLALDPVAVIGEDVLVRMAATVTAKRYAPAAQQFGWYARHFEQHQTAKKWFETALQWAPEDEAAAYGLALVYLQLGEHAGFAAVQKQWAERSPRIATLTDTSAPAARERRIASRQVVQTAGEPAPAVWTPARSRTASCSGQAHSGHLSPTAALAYGWCLLELNRPMEAVASFEAAIGDRRTREDAVYGQSLAYLRLGLTDKAAVAATKAPMRPAWAHELQASILADRAVQAFDSKRYREALLYLDQRTEVQQESVDLMVLRGYAYMNLNRPHEALRIFEAAAATGSRDASRGMADARAAMGRN